MNWEKEPDIKKLKRAIENCYMMAKRKRTIIHRYYSDELTGKVHSYPIGPKSTDEDWDHIIRFCESTGLKMSILRLQREEIEKLN
jgi:hypothetical protein